MLYYYVFKKEVVIGLDVRIRYRPMITSWCKRVLVMRLKWSWDGIV